MAPALKLFRNEFKLLQLPKMSNGVALLIFLNESKLAQWRGRAAMRRHQHCDSSMNQNLSSGEDAQQCVDTSTAKFIPQ